MFLIIDGDVADWDLDMLAEILAVIDRQLDSILSDWHKSSKTVELPCFERAEHIMGLGFVSCQAYMTATYGFLNMPKSKALAAGPLHRSGQRIVEIVNHGANYWKHREEWHLDRSPTNQNRIGAAFDAVEAAGFPIGQDYPLSGVLTALVEPEPMAFKPLVAMLARWREDLRGDSR